MSTIQNTISTMLAGLRPDQLLTVFEQVLRYYRTNLENELYDLSPEELVEFSGILHNHKTKNATPPVIRKYNHPLISTPLPRDRLVPAEMSTPPSPPVFETSGADCEERIPLPPLVSDSPTPVYNKRRMGFIIRQDDIDDGPL
jgi:hypothetical protein